MNKKKSGIELFSELSQIWLDNNKMDMSKKDENIKRFTEADLPTDKEVEMWYEDTISQECSASSAIYLFRLYLKERLTNSKLINP